ncbi:type VI secretion system baseplate subunit TssK [Parashewanella tropica]|uniref:type VI secretion system baseplate subunit TssK n=1 Tax=Parashewanella tropica TaxID=2547970 RepID=UPI00105A58C9|nr:type VI secretion system baseplate subunit TssK [Parashewanella tropica]
MDTNKIVWSEGMFLSPQHFQQQDRYHEYFTRQLIEQNNACFYGLTALHIDNSLLTIGKVSITHAKGIFPDGTPFEILESLTIEIPSSTTNKLVYLALPLTRTGAVNVGKSTRFRFSPFEYATFDTTREHSDSVQLELGKLNIVLKLEGDDLQDYIVLSVAKVMEFRSEGEVILSKEFVPNCLYYNVSHYLTNGITDLAAHMQYRATTIATRLQTEESSKSYQALLRDYLWLQALCTWLPKFRHDAEMSNAATYQLYLDCISLYGQMCGLENRVPKTLRQWNQSELYSVFVDLFSEIKTLLSEIKLDNVTSLKWDESLFASRRLLRTVIPDRNLFKQGRFILVVTSSIGSVRLNEEFPKSAKLAGNSTIVNLVRSAIQGVGLLNLPYAPSELKSKVDASYFEVDVQSELWKQLVDKEDPIALHIDERIEDVCVEFHVIR